MKVKELLKMFEDINPEIDILNNENNHRMKVGKIIKVLQSLDPEIDTSSISNSDLKDLCFSIETKNYA
jgi:hypothetical protein